MASNMRETYIATHGDYAVKAAGEAIFIAGKNRQGRNLNVKAGEIVVFDPTANVTIAAADIPSKEKVVVAVGVGNKGEMATDLRYLGGDGFNLCKDSIEALVTTPVCGTPQVLDVFFDGTKCQAGYAFQILLDDYIVRSNYPQNDRMAFTYNEINPCGSDCSCTTEDSCEELVCKFVDAINKKTTEDDARNLVRFQNRDDSHQYQPFSAAMLYNVEDSIKTFCLTPEDSDCENCSTLPAITGILIGDEETEFVGTTIGDYTTPGQLELVVDLINDALAPTGGRAHLVKSIGKCCGYCIEISSCETTIELLSGDDANITGTGSNAFDNVAANAAVCSSCDSADTQITATCGFRLYAHPLSVKCSCEYPPNDNIPFTYHRSIEVQPLNDWGCQTFYVLESTAQIEPEGFGFFYQDREHYQHNGGVGRDYHYSNTHRGQISLPDQYSRSTNATTIDCEETYCVYNLRWIKSALGKNSNALTRSNTAWTFVLIPYGDDVTKASWETFLAELHTIGTCVTQDITC